MLRLDYVSPLPPTRTGIADYSADLLPHLASRCDLRLIALPGQAVSQELRARWRPAAVDELGRGSAAVGAPGGEPRLPLYMMGNNVHHLPVWRAAMATAGVLVLHDLVLHHFQLERTLARGDAAGYTDQLAADHGWVGERVAAPARRGILGNTAQFALPLRHSLLVRQRGVLVHSLWGVDELREEDPRLRVARVPMPVPLPAPADLAAGLELRRRLGIPDGAPVLASVGFQTPMKRTALAVRALAEPALAQAHLLVAGEVSPYSGIESLARELGVERRVHMMGYVPFAELERVIAAADLCLNLRFPTAGETSASLLRILALGRPAVVSDYAQFRELPDEAVLKVPVGEQSAGELAARVAAVVAAPERLRALGEAGRRYVARAHDPAAAAAALVEACLEWQSAAPPGLPAAAERPPSSLVWGDLPGELAVEGVEAWSPGERRRIRFRLRNRGVARWLPAAHGQGGVALRLELHGPGVDASRPLEWLPLPHELPPGGEHVFETTLRRPLGPVRLRALPRLVGMDDLAQFGGPWWEGDV